MLRPQRLLRLLEVTMGRMLESHVFIMLILPLVLVIALILLRCPVSILSKLSLILICKAKNICYGIIESLAEVAEHSYLLSTHLNSLISRKLIHRIRRIILRIGSCNCLTQSTVHLAPIEIWWIILTIVTVIILIKETVLIHSVPSWIANVIIIFPELWSAHLWLRIWMIFSLILASCFLAAFGFLNGVLTQNMKGLGLSHANPVSLISRSI